jgi:hypothetical protein
MIGGVIQTSSEKPALGPGEIVGQMACGKP